MLRVEAAWIHDVILRLGFDRGSIRCLNLGSSTRHYREVEQPQIKELIIDPLLQLGSINNVDFKEDDGVDQVGDFCDSRFVAALAAQKYDIILCNNILTHVKHPECLFEIIERCSNFKGYVIITAPSIYPYCADPYDSKYRPKLQDIESSLPGFNVIKHERIISSESHFYRLKRNPRLLFGLLFNLLFPVRGFDRWFGVASDLPNLNRKFETLCVALQRSS